MDPADYPWGNQNNIVSSLDLLEEEVLREASKPGPQWKRDKYLLVEGEPAATFPREISRISPRKPKPVSKTTRRRKSNVSSSRGNRSRNNNTEEEEEEEGSKKQLQLENERLQREISQWQREVEHARDEKLELEASFRRLDQEIGNGYHLAERKEKEVRIAELVTKNQKMSQLLEKKLQGHDELRGKHAELQEEHKRLTDQVTLLNRVLNSVETKHAELSTSHSSLTASYEAAHHRIEALQRDNLVLQEKLSTSNTHVQVVNEYESKIQQWERTCRELEQKCEYKSNKLKQTQKIASATQQEAQRALDRQGELEQELQDAYNHKIQLNAAVRAMEAKLEENLQVGSTQEALHRQIRQLEGALLLQNRANAELMQTCNQLLSSQRRPRTVKTPLTTRNDHAMASRVAKLTLTITSLTDKLRMTEEARNRKSRSLDILMQAFPFLLRCLDATRDQLTAAVESNDIIKNALEQIHDPNLLNRTNVNEVSVSGPMYLRLARHKYLLEAPYPIELLADQMAAQVLKGNPESATAFARAKAKRFPPFRVACSVLKGRDNQVEDENEDQMHLVLLSADSSDISGASYLNRSKINAFLEVIQSSAARKKFKTLVIGKLAEYMSKLRELAHRSASEAAVHQTSIQMLQREVAELQQELKMHNEGLNRDFGENGKVHKTRQFLLKMVDVYAEKQHENDHRQITFLTQPLTSDILITNTQNGINGPPDDRLCLSNCELDDDDVAQLLLKIHVSGVRFREINLSSNNLSDVGAQYVADFLEKAPASVRVVSLNDNKRISRYGVELIKRGLLRNQRVQRVKEDRECGDGVILRGLAIQQEFEVTGEGTDIICVILPITSENDGTTVDLKTTTPEAVDAMTEKLRQLGFRYNIRPKSAPSRLRPTTYNSKNRGGSQRTDVRPRSASAAPSSRKAPVPSSTITRRKSLPGTFINAAISRRQQIKQQQEQRFQCLEAAIRRASTPSQRVQATRSSAPTQLNSRISRRSVNRNTVGSNRRSVGNTHINTIRGLRP
ncbi:hypothetical protein V7S43_006483 [Phytophthora oleae]|uniref:Uncharacterized protein n=1 Tax=Phytophthora oleae TaxID=2107226 RepID=A0ABD3FRR4_9STRA